MLTTNVRGTARSAALPRDQEGLTPSRRAASSGVYSSRHSAPLAFSFRIAALVWSRGWCIVTSCVKGSENACMRMAETSGDDAPGCEVVTFGEMMSKGRAALVRIRAGALGKARILGSHSCRLDG